MSADSQADIRFIAFVVVSKQLEARDTGIEQYDPGRSCVQNGRSRARKD